MYNSTPSLISALDVVWVVNATPRPLYPGKEPLPIVQEAGWALVPVCTAAENLVPTGESEIK
jgi:hypothetical protein